MTQIGLDGNDAPATMEGIAFDTWLGIQGRAYTWLRREPYRPDYALGLVDGLRDPAPPSDEWRRRLQASFADLSGGDAFDFEVAVAGETARLQVSIREAA